MATHTEPVTIGNIRVELEVNKLKHSVKPELKNFFGTYGLNADRGQFDSYEVPTGTIESIALRRGLKALRVRGIDVPLKSSNPVDDFPDISEAELEHDVDLYEEALKALVKHNLWLGKKAPYAMVFGPYLPADEQENPALLDIDEADEGGEVVQPAADPTPSSQATSGERLLSGSDLVSEGRS